METISIREARRLALAKAGLLKPEWTGLPARAAGAGARARAAAHRHIERFGYLQLDTVSVAGARSHALVLLSRVAGLAPELGEALLKPGAPLFEYWGHEVCWLPLELYPVFAFRRERFRHHPWWGDVIGAHPELVTEVMRRITAEGPLRSADFDGPTKGGWWAHKPVKKVIVALWSSGELAIRERRAFQRTFDLAERVIPAEYRGRDLSHADALRVLVRKALDGHGWADYGTIGRTWRLLRQGKAVQQALQELEAAGAVVRCALVEDGGKRAGGWIQPDDLALAARLARVRPAEDDGVLLSPFDPVLWERSRVQRLFGFDQVLEIFKPAPQRKYGYYCLPVLAGERLVARLDLKAERKAGRLRVVAAHYEKMPAGGPTPAAVRAVTRRALGRYAESLGLDAHGLR